MGMMGAGVGLGGGGLPFGAGIGAFGKRSVNDSDIAANGTVCTLSTERSVVSCKG